MDKKNTEDTSKEEVVNVVEPTNEELIEKFETQVEIPVDEVVTKEPEVISAPVEDVRVEDVKVKKPVVNTDELNAKNVELYKIIKSTHFGKMSNETIEEYVNRVFSAIVLNSIEYNENLDKLNSIESKIRVKNYSFVFDEYLETIKQGFSNPNYCIEMESVIGMLKQKISML